MIGKLFSKSFLSLAAALVVFNGFDARGQATTITTNYTSAANSAFNTIPTLDTLCITFTVTNGNSYPIVITEVGAFHMASAPVNYPPLINVTNNGSPWELWRTSTQLTGNATNIDATGSGWVKEAAVASFSSGVNGIVPIFTNLAIQVPPNTTNRFAVALFDTMMVAVGVSGPSVAPKFFSSNGVVLTSGDSNTRLGIFPNATARPDSIGFLGSIKFESLKPPTVTAKSQNVCVNGRIELTAQSDPFYQNPTYTWFKGTTQLQQGPSNKLIIDPAKLSDDGVYSVTVKGSNNPYTSLPATIEVNIIDPPAPTVEGKFDYCLNEPFEPVTVIGGTPRWYYDDTGGSPIPVPPTINTSTPNTLVYYVAITDANGCESTERTMVRFRAAKKPAPPIVSTPVYYCEDMPAEQLSAIGDTLSWYYDPVGGVPSSIAPTPNTSKQDSFQYFVTQKIDGCESDRNKIDVVVTFRPNGLIRIDKEEICAEDSIVLNYFGSAFPGAGFNWALPDEGATNLNNGRDQGPIHVKLDSPGKFQIMLRVGVKGCMSEVYTQDVSVKRLPTGLISTKDDVCLGQPELVTTEYYTLTTDSFQWNFDGGRTTHFTTDQGPYGVYWETAGEKVIQLRLVDEGCADTLFDTIMVHAKPDAGIIAENYMEGDEICTSDSFKVYANTIDASSTYMWSPAAFFKTDDNDPVTYASVHYDGEIILKVEDEFGCVNQDTLKVKTKPCCEMTFPTAFTPNNDGKNDLFRPITIGHRPVKTFRVVNRYGQTVFETTDITRGWDGSMNGKPADLGTYFYLISFTCDNKTVDQAGEVVLLR